MSTPKDSNYDSFIAKIEHIRREFGWNQLPQEYFRNMCSATTFTRWLDNLQLSDSFIDSHTTRGGYLTFYSQNLTADKLFSSSREKSHILKANSNINCTETGNCGILIKIFNSPGIREKKYRFDIQVCFAPDSADPGSEVHFHNELVFRINGIGAH